MRPYDNSYYTGYTLPASYKVIPSTTEKDEEVYLVVKFTHPFPLKRNYLNVDEPKTYTYCILLESGFDLT